MMLTDAIAGLIVVLACWAMVTWSSKRLRAKFRAELGALSTAVRMLQQNAAPVRVAAEGPSTPPPTPKVITAEKASRPVPAPHLFQAKSDQDCGEISGDVRAAIEAALVTRLGRQVYLLSITEVEKAEAGANWVSQGRMAVQSSHNQRATRD